MSDNTKFQAPASAYEMDPVVITKRAAIAAAIDRDVLANVSPTRTSDWKEKVGNSDAARSRPNAGDA